MTAFNIDTYVDYKYFASQRQEKRRDNTYTRRNLNIHMHIHTTYILFQRNMKDIPSHMITIYNMEGVT